MLLDPQVNANALTWAADADKARTSANIDVGEGSSLMRGWMQWNAAGTGDRGWRGLFPRGIKVSARMPSPKTGPMTR